MALNEYIASFALGDLGDEVTVQFKNGFNLDVDAAATEEVQNAGGKLFYRTNAAKLTLNSSSANDTADGTGARTVKISGLDTSWNPISEVVTLNGTEDVDTVNSFFRVIDMKVESKGTGSANAGNITAWWLGKSNIVGVIPTSKGTWGNSAVSTQSDQTVLIPRLSMSMTNTENSNGSCLFELFHRTEVDGVMETWRRDLAQDLAVNGSSSIQVNDIASLKFPPKTDIRFQVKASANNTAVAVNYDLFSFKG